jgi:hypothetical protein
LTEKLVVEKQERRRITFDTALTLAAALECLVAAGAVGAFALQMDMTQRGPFVGTAVLVGGASAALGAFVGFLFGVPKALQSNAGSERTSRFASNSNLEQISDWLTKILVGVGLVQIGSLPGALGQLGATLKPSFGNLDSSPAFAVGLVIYFFFIAFMLQYMWTRTRFLQILDDYEPPITRLRGYGRTANMASLSTRRALRRSASRDSSGRAH